MPQKIPKYSELPVIEKTGERHAWDVFGRDDQLGSINFLTAERVKHAATLVRTGKVINLSLPLNFPITLYGGHRTGYKQTMTVNRGGRDDFLDNFALQGSSQWDGLRHVRYREFGYWGGRQDEDLDQKGQIGMEHWARHGIIGRGVLLDLPRYMEKQRTPFKANTKVPMDGPLMEKIAASENVQFVPGDILLLRTGWLAWYKSLDEASRDKLQGTLTNQSPNPLKCPGLDPSKDTAAWVWDHQIAALAADNPALEALEVLPEVGFQHRRLLPLQGTPIGEFWDLEELSSDCAQDGVFQFMLVSAPLYIPGGVGSPPNAYALK